MFVHYYIAKHPESAKAVMPVFGLPLVGTMDVPKKLKKMPILSLHDRMDTTIPW